LDAVGLDRVPDCGPLVLAVRHYHHLLDGVGLIRQVKRPLHILIALDWVAKPRTRAMMEGLAQWAAWPVTLRSEELEKSEGGASATSRRAYTLEEVSAYQRHAYRECVNLLCHGEALVIFPEGYPVIDPHAKREKRSTLLAPFKSGFARLAIAASRVSGDPINVLPVGIQVQPTGGLIFVYGHSRPVTASSDVETVTREVYDDVCSLSTPGASGIKEK
jgi:putative membrane protein